MLRGERTVIERVRYDGVARCSRAFDENGAARVMFSQLGPGTIHGDRIEIVGHVAAGAHLIVTEQSATRILGGAAPSSYAAHWTVDAGATLDLRAEPIVARYGGDHRIVTSCELADDATLVMRECASVDGGTRLDLRSRATIGGHERYYDALEFDASTRDVVGTFVMLGRAWDIEAIDRYARSHSDVRCGVGVLAHGLLVRVTGASIWSVQAALGGFHACAQGAMVPA